MLVSLLERLGYDVDEAVDGIDALEVIERERPDLVLTDLDMPIMDGFKLTERLRENPATQEIPVIVISTRGSDADKKRAAEAGADGYIVKSSFRAEEFNRTLALYLESGR
jgi:two-component system chemotaxis sensor kinase CheA